MRDTTALVRAWLARSGVSEGAAFRSLSRGRLGGALRPGQIGRIFKLMARDAGLSAEMVAQISGHSTRVGAAQDMVAEGIGLGAIVRTVGSPLGEYGLRSTTAPRAHTPAGRSRDRHLPARSPW